jgi:hypothetical protein
VSDVATTPVRRALVSCFDKTGVAALAAGGPPRGVGRGPPPRGAPPPRRHTTAWHDPPEGSTLHLDHVVLAARSRSAAERSLERAGLGVARGRELPGLGLSNLVVPLGSALLEVHYPDGRTPAPDTPPLLDIDRDALAAAPAAPLVPVAWIVAYEDRARLLALAELHDAPVLDAPDEGPGFPPYVLAGFGATYDRPWLPALIHWPVPHAERPAALPAPHRRRPTGISRLDVAGPVDDIRRWCGGWPAGVHAVDGTDGPRSVEVGFADGGRVRFGAT